MKIYTNILSFYDAIFMITNSVYGFDTLKVFKQKDVVITHLFRYPFHSILLVLETVLKLLAYSLSQT